jgi:lipopolysaccharide biosynthesis glycosyltransferase
MSEPIHIVFTPDRKFLPGLHITARSILASSGSAVHPIHFHIFTESLTARDASLLETTLRGANLPFLLDLQEIQTDIFTGFPAMLGSLAIYYRLVVPELLNLERFIYVDVDTLCDVDLGELAELDMGDAPAGLVPEAPLAKAVDRFVAKQLGDSPVEPYFNAGVILVNVVEWRRQKITEQTLNYIAAHRPAFHDQAALNYVLHRRALTLDPKFNCIANMRKNWPALRMSLGQTGVLAHFLDHPKPWDFLGEFVHPQYQLWRSVLDKTAIKHFRSWHATPSRKFPKTRQAWIGYKKAIKDRLLFLGYSRGWLRRVKGVPFLATPATSDRPAL